MQQYDAKYENVDEAAKTLKPNITDLKVSFLHEVVTTLHENSSV